MRKPAAFVAILLLASCATQQQSQVGTAITTPVSDLNLVHAPIPDVLVAAGAALYWCRPIRPARL